MNKPSASFLRAKNARDEIPASCQFQSPSGSPRVGQKLVDVNQAVNGVNRPEGSIETDDGLTPDELEQAIAEVGQRFVEAAERYIRTSDFADKGEADRLWLIQKHLIGLRSKEWVCRVEIERGLV